MNATLEQTVGELVVEKPSRARVFERYGIDYCCGGKKPLGQACLERNVDPKAVVESLLSADAQPAVVEKSWANASLAELADHIEATHHDYLKSELPRLEYLTRKVAAVHGPHRPELIEVHEVFCALKAEMESHMMKEEQILFPLCRQLDAAEAGEVPPAFHCGSINNPIRVRVQEHEHAGDAVERIREWTDGYTPPADACNTYRAMLAILEDLERDMHQHVHKENNILFPKAAEAEARVRG